jgi:hypothetical protein
MFDMTFFTPRRLHAGLTLLGKDMSWVRLEQGSMFVDTAKMGRIEGGDGVVTRLMVESKIKGEENARAFTYSIIAIARCLALGPKLLTLDAETCRALMHLKIDVTLADFAMPYEAMIVQFPAEWVREVYAATGTPPSFPPYTAMIISHSSEDRRIISVLAAPGQDVVALNISPTAYDTIEERLRFVEDSPGEIPALVSYERIAYNVALMACYAGVKSTGWIDPAQHAKHLKLARKDDRGRRLLAGDVERVAFEQDVHLLLGITYADRAADAGGTHVAPHPHWRKQHWYMQAYGPDYSLRRLRLRRRTFVRAHALPPGVAPEDIQTDYNVELPGRGDGDDDRLPTA